MGSDMTWQCVGQDSFTVTLTLYRDCNGVNMGGANITFKCKTTGQTLTNKSIGRPAPTDITPTCDESCTRCDSRTCSFQYGIQRFVFQTGIVVLNNAGSCCEILMSFQSCCRNGVITTGMAHQSFYCDAMLNRCVTPCDNSPTFSNVPIAIICVGQDFVFNHGVTDLDVDSSGGLTDSLTYLWTDPLGNNAAPLTYSPPYNKNRAILQMLISLHLGTISSDV